MADDATLLHRVRQVLDLYDRWEKPDGKKLLADLHLVLEDTPRDILDRELDEIREKYWREHGGEG